MGDIKPYFQKNEKEVDEKEVGEKGEDEKEVDEKGEDEKEVDEKREDEKKVDKKEVDEKREDDMMGLEREEEFVPDYEEENYILLSEITRPVVGVVSGKALEGLNNMMTNQQQDPRGYIYFKSPKRLTSNIGKVIGGRWQAYAARAARNYKGDRKRDYNCRF